MLNTHRVSSNPPFRNGIIFLQTPSPSPNKNGIDLNGEGGEYGMENINVMNLED